MAEAQHLHHVLARPFLEPAEVGPSSGSSVSGREPGHSAGRPIQSPEPAGRVQRLRPMPVVAQDAIARPAVLHLQRCLEAELLEAPPFSRRVPSISSSCMRWSKAKILIARPVPVPVGGPVDLLQFGIVAQIGPHDPAVEEELQLLPDSDRPVCSRGD